MEKKVLDGFIHGPSMAQIETQETPWGDDDTAG
jgi:hypothetical protein